MIETDEQVYSRYLAQHREEDLRILLERHRESLTLFLMSYVNNEEDAEELMLDAYAEAAAGGSFSGRSSFKTWLFSIGKNLALMRLRKERFQLHAKDGQAESTAAPPDLDILRGERDRQLYLALDRLKDEYRQILILLYFEDMSPEEAGRVMGRNRKQIYNLTERGKKALRDELERMGFDGAQY